MLSMKQITCYICSFLALIFVIAVWNEPVKPIPIDNDTAEYAETNPEYVSDGGPEADEGNTGSLENIVVIVIDGLRYDAIENAGMDEFKRLAGEGLFFQAISAGNRTYPGFASILTGRYMFEMHNTRNWLEETSIAEILKNNSFDTLLVSACVGDQGFTKWNWHKGFDVYEAYEGEKDAPWFFRGEKYLDVIESNLLDFFYKTKRPGQNNRNFMLFHFEEQLRMLEGAEDPIETYHSEARDTDRAVAALREMLGRYGVGPHNTTYIITADHGKALGEYGQYGHGIMLEPPEYEIPLILSGYGIEHMPDIERVAVHQDIIPTILTFAGIEYDSEDYIGRDLLSGLDKEPVNRTFYVINPGNARTFNVRAIDIPF